MKFFGWIFLVIIFVWAAISCGADRIRSYHYIRVTPPVLVARVRIPIWIDKNFSGADLASLDLAIAEWNFVLNGHINLEVVSRDFDILLDDPLVAEKMDGWLILKINSSDKSIKKYNWLAYCDKVGGHYMYIIRDRLLDKDIKPIALHEFGHLLGSKHVGPHVMHKYYLFERYSCIDRETAEEVAFHWNLTVDRLNFCIPDS